MKNQMPASGLKHGRDLMVRSYALAMKAIGEDGTFSGYGSVFGVIDFYQEIVQRGAFTESLKEIAARGRPLPMLWSHMTTDPIGFYTKLAEDEQGLFVEGQLLKNDVQRAREVHALMKAGVVTGLSIGYWVRESSFDEKTGIRTLTRLDLDEVSPCTFPANDEARIDNVKFKLARGSLPSIREFESVLREAGYSKTQAAAIASRGYASMLRRDAAGGDGETALLSGLKGLLDEARKFDLP